MNALKVGDFRIQYGNDEAIVMHNGECVCSIPITKLESAMCGLLQQRGYSAFRFLENGEAPKPANMPESCPHCGCDVAPVGVYVTEDGDTCDIYGSWPGYVFCLNCKKRVASIAMSMNFLQPYTCFNIDTPEKNEDEKGDSNG